MTISRLETYRSLKRQVEILEAELNPSIIKGVNFENVVVQSGKTSNPTADFAMQKIENECAAEYLRQKAELLELTKYITHIGNQEVKEIAIRRYMKGQTFEEIGEAMFMDRRTVSRKLISYVAHNAH